MSIVKKLIAKVANEPVVHITGTLTAALTWLATYVLGDFSPTTQHQIVAGAVTLIVYAISWIARQYVTPTVKLATGKHAVEAVAKPVLKAGAEKVAKDVIAVVKEDAEKLIKAAEPTTEPTEAEFLSRYLASVTPASTNPDDYDVKAAA